MNERHEAGDPLAAERNYVEEVEQALRQVRGKPVVLTPADLDRVLVWFRGGVPLALVLRTIETLAGRDGGTVQQNRAAGRSGVRRGSRPRSLGYFAEAIDEAHELLSRARLGARPPGGTEPTPESLQDLLLRAAAAVASSCAPEPQRSAAAERLRACALGLGGPGEEPDLIGRLDRQLLDACRASLDESEREALRRAVLAELAPFLSGMSPTARQRAETLGEIRILRQRFSLPDLALLPLFG